MTNQDIETFFAVLDHGTMTAAAEALYICLLYTSDAADE